jgi:hypothetical protein
MANEITHNYTTGLTLYFCCFQQNGDVFLTGGASDEVWGTGARTADDYDETMTEEATSGHYKGSMAAGVGAGVYQIAVYLQAGANPADADICIGQGEIYWDGSAEINLSVIDTVVDAILVDTGTTLENHLTDVKGTGFVKDTDSLVDLAHTGADSDTLETLSDEIEVVDANVDTILANTGKVVNVYPTGEKREITGGATVGIEED